jgi:hypothetical protein
LQAKKWEIFRIAQENHLIKKRIVDIQPMINNRKFEETFKKNQEYMEKICYFPFIFKKSENKKRSEISSSKERDFNSNAQKTFTFFSKLHLDSKNLEETNTRVTKTAYSTNKRKLDINLF